MGNKTSAPIISYEVAVQRLGDETVSTLRRAYTKLTQSSGGSITSSGFISRILSPRFPSMPPLLASRLWLSVCPSGEERAGEGRSGVGWEEIIIFIALVTCSPVSDKANLLFNIYDVEGGGAALHSADLVTFMGAVLYDRPKAQADYAAAVRDLMAAAVTRRTDVISKEEWRAWCIAQAAVPGAWEKHPLTGWIDHVAAAFKPDPEVADSMDAADGLPPTPDAAAGLPRRAELCRLYAKIKGRADGGVLDSTCFIRLLQPLVPRAVADRLFGAADVGRNGALSQNDFTDLVEALISPSAEQSMADIDLIFRMFDPAGSGRLSVAELQHLVELSFFCDKILAGCQAKPVAVEGVVMDATTGKLNDVLYAQLAASSKTQAKHVTAALSAELPEGADLNEFRLWASRRAELTSITALIREALFFDVGIRPLGGVGKAFAVLAQCAKSFAIDSYTLPGEEWYVLPSAWLRTCAQQIVESKLGRSPGISSIPGPVPTDSLVLGPLTDGILRPGLNEDSALLPAFIRACTTESAPASLPPSAGDYVLVPPRFWRTVRRWFGVQGPDIVRKVISISNRSLQLELYPPWIRAYRLSVKAAAVPAGKTPAAKKPGQPGEPNTPTVPPTLMPVNNASMDSASNLYVFSCNDTVETILTALGRSAYLNPANLRLWVSSIAASAHLVTAPRDEKALKEASKLPLWPFTPLFGGKLGQSKLYDLDVLDEEGACVILDSLSPVDGVFSSVSTGYASLFFLKAEQEAPSATPLESVSRDDGRSLREEITITPFVYPGAYGPVHASSGTQIATPPKKGKPTQKPAATALAPAYGQKCLLRLHRMPRCLVGLANLGNTCYLNSALQCLLHTPLLASYFLSEEWAYDINPTAKLGTHGVLAAAFADLVGEVWKADPLRREGSISFGAVAPRRLKHWLSEAAPRFGGNEQHDSQEAFATLLSFLAEDLNRVKEKPYVEQPDSNGRPDHIVAEEWWIGHLKREQSLLSTLFTGQFKSILTCEQCGFSSSTFEPFTTLSLPLPESRRRCFTLTVIFPHPIFRPLVVTVVCDPSQRIADVKAAVAKEVSTHCRRVLACQVQAVSTRDQPAAAPVTVLRQTSLTDGTGEDADTAVSATAGVLGVNTSKQEDSKIKRMQRLLTPPRTLTPGDFAAQEFHRRFPKYEHLIIDVNAAASEAVSPSAYNNDFRAVNVSADKITIVRAAAHSILEHSAVTSMSNFVSGGGGSSWELADDFPVAALRDSDSASYLAFITWNSRHYRQAYKECVSEFAKSRKEERIPPELRVGAPVWAPWKATSGRVFPAWIVDMKTNPSPVTTNEDVDSDDDSHTMPPPRPVCDLVYDDGDVDNDVPIDTLRPRELTVNTFLFVNRVTMPSTAVAAPFTSFTAMEPTTFTYTPGITKLVRIPGLIVTSPTVSSPVSKVSGEALPRLAYGIGAMGGVHGVGGPAYCSSSCNTLFPSTRRAVFGTPHLLKLLPSDPCETLYTRMAHVTQRFIRRTLPMSDAVLNADATAKNIADKWGFVLRRVQHADPTMCSQCTWLRACPGCIIPVSASKSIAAIRLREGECIAVDWDCQLLDDSLDKVELVAKDIHASVLTAIASETSSITLDQCLDVFSREERLEEHRYCPKCSKVKTLQTITSSTGTITREEEDIVFRSQTKQLQVWRLPPVLLVQLKRFQHNQYGRRKLNNLVSFPIEGMTLQSYVAKPKTFQPPADLTWWKYLGGKLSPEGEAAKSKAPALTSPAPTSAPSSHPRFRAASTGPIETNFDGIPNMLSRNRAEYLLYGVVSHQGMLGAGHYVAFTKSFIDNKWYCFNDRYVSPVDSPAEIVSAGAYMLFYVRKDIDVGWQTALAMERAAATMSTPKKVDEMPLECWDLFPHRPGSIPFDVSTLKAQVANAGLAAEALGFMDSLVDKCTVM